MRVHEHHLHMFLRKVLVYCRITSNYVIHLRKGTSLWYGIHYAAIVLPVRIPR